MKTLIACCVTTFILMALYMVQNRYEFFIHNPKNIAIGDHWTGCVNFIHLGSKSGYKIVENTNNYDELEKFLKDAPSKNILFAESIQTEC